MSTIASTPKLIRAALDDEGGSVAMMFGLMAFTVLTFVGSAIDIGRWMQARRTTMEAIDSATLSGLRTYQEQVAWASRPTMPKSRLKLRHCATTKPTS